MFRLEPEEVRVPAATVWVSCPDFPALPMQRGQKVITEGLNPARLGEALKTAAIVSMIKVGTPYRWNTTESFDRVKDRMATAFLSGEIDREGAVFHRKGGYIHVVFAVENDDWYEFRYSGDFGDLLMEAINAAP